MHIIKCSRKFEKQKLRDLKTKKTATKAMALPVLDAVEVTESAKKKKEQEKPFGPSLLSTLKQALVLLALLNCF